MTPGSMLGGFGRCICARSYRGEKRTGAVRRRSKRFAEPVAVSSTEPPDFPILALADLLVQPFGSASTYSRAALGALVNLGCLQGSCKSKHRRKLRTLRKFNNHHFHSALCNLWITGRGARTPKPRVASRPGVRLEILRLDITPVLVHGSANPG